MKLQEFLDEAKNLKAAYVLAETLDRIQVRHGYYVVSAYVVKSHLRAYRRKPRKVVKTSYQMKKKVEVKIKPAVYDPKNYPKEAKIADEYLKTKTKLIDPRKHKSSSGLFSCKWEPHNR